MDSPQKCRVFFDRFDAVDRHAPLDAAPQRAGLVERQVVLAVLAQQISRMRRFEACCGCASIGSARAHARLRAE